MKATLSSALIAFLIPIAMVMGYNLAHDPFQYYHTPENSRFSTNDRWQNPGLIRQYDHDTVLIGTSRSQNFQPAMFEPAGWRLLKAAAAGSKADEQLATLRLALSTGYAERVLMELSYTSFSYNRPDQNNTFPSFLYEPNLETPFLYLLSYDLIFKSLYNHDKTDQTLEDLYVWWPDHHNEFGERQMVKKLATSCGNPGRKPEPRSRPPTARYLAELAVLVGEHQEVSFIGFFPPVPALTLVMDQEVSLQERLVFREAIAEIARARQNLKIFDYASVPDIVLDLSRYKDVDHYDMDVTRQMAREMQGGTGPYADLANVNRKLLQTRSLVDRSKIPCNALVGQARR